jgi:predicted ATPase
VRADLPTGTVTFLFTDVEGSTKLLHELGAEAYADALAEHRRVVREACVAEGGVEVDTQGDAFFFAFPSAPGGAAAAQAMTEAVAPGRIHLRIGLHTGTPVVTDEGYVGDDVHLAARIAASGHGGQVVLSQATGALLDGHHVTDLGEHRLKDIEGAVAIFQLGDSNFPPLKTISNTNLPRPASSFVGRGAELAEVLSLIEGGSRLLTLTGPGGSGKTRLALEVASTLVPEYKAGAFWVGLAALRDASLVSATISRTIGSTNGLAEHIGQREMLLLLDNLEQVIEVAPEVSALLPACPNLTLLVTSRERLRVQGEIEYEVPPLASPEAVSLFCARSRLEPSDEITELCARLDNLPLALELAAARTKALTPRQILERLAERLDLLRGGRDADPRQQTLRATIEWSYGLLSDEEQRLFRALSVFAGGCTLDAAEEVSNAELDTCQSLVEKSLLRFSNERYWMLETIREYAREQLDHAGEAADFDRRHALHFLARVDQEYADRTGPRRAEILTWFGAEVDNLRAMLDSLAVFAPADATRTAHKLFQFWRSLGASAEAEQRLQMLLNLELSDSMRAQILADLAEVQEARGDLDAATTTAAEALRLSTPGTHPRVIALLISSSSEVLRGNVDEGVRLGRRAVDEAKTLDAMIRIATLGDLAMVLVQAGRREEARTALHEAVEDARRSGERMNAEWGEGQLGFVDLLDGDYKSARRALARAVTYARSVDHYPFEASMLLWLGFAQLGLEQRAAARSSFGELLELSSASSKTITPYLAAAIRGLALAVERVDLRDGARLHGAVETLREEAGGLRTPMSREENEIEARFERTLIEALGDDGYEKQQAAGAAMGLDETIELARSLADG